MCNVSAYINNNYDQDRIFVHYGSSNFYFLNFKMPVNWLFRDKPQGGLWGSLIDSKFGWKDWCDLSGFRDLRSSDCFYFRVNSQSVLELDNVEDLEELPFLEPPSNDSFFTGMRTLDYEALRNDMGIAAVIVNHAEVKDLLNGFDCDSIVVLDPYCIVVNYDAKYKENPITLSQLLPLWWYKTIFFEVEVSFLKNSPDGKCYVYFEKPDALFGFKTLVASIADGEIVEICGFSEDEAHDILQHILVEKDDIIRMIEYDRYVVK